MHKIFFIYADLQKPANKEHTIALTTLGTLHDFKRYNIKLQEGNTYWFWTDNIENDPLIFKAIVKFNPKSNIWIADYDPTSIKPLSKSEFSGIYSNHDVTGA